MTPKQRTEAIAEYAEKCASLAKNQQGDAKGSGEAAAAAPVAGWSEEWFPRMPVSIPAVAQAHRQKEPAHPLWLEACVARPVNKREVEKTPAARAALEKEWQKLYAAGCWDEKDVREWSSVASTAQKNGQKAHIGRIFEICVEKSSELPPGHADRKYKGRVVFQGNLVKGE